MLEKITNFIGDHSKAYETIVGFGFILGCVAAIYGIYSLVGSADLTSDVRLMASLLMVLVVGILLFVFIGIPRLILKYSNLNKGNVYTAFVVLYFIFLFTPK